MHLLFWSTTVVVVAAAVAVAVVIVLPTKRAQVSQVLVTPDDTISLILEFITFGTVVVGSVV